MLLYMSYYLIHCQCKKKTPRASLSSTTREHHTQYIVVTSYYVADDKLRQTLIIAECVALEHVADAQLRLFIADILYLRRHSSCRSRCSSCRK